GSHQYQESDPDSLVDKRRTRHPFIVQFPGREEKQPITSHGVRDARASKNQSIVAAKRGNDDGHGHDGCAHRSEDGVQGSARHTPVRDRLDLYQRQSEQVSQIRRQYSVMTMIVPKAIESATS